jgi:hypothetical protein
MGPASVTARGALNHVLQLANVAWPVVLDQRARASTDMPLTVWAATVAFQEQCSERCDVLAAVAERRHPDRQHVETVIEVVAKASHSDERLEVDLGYAITQRKRNLVEEIFGWMKTVGGFRRTRFKGRRRTHLAATAYNLLRICKLTAPQA